MTPNPKKQPPVRQRPKVYWFICKTCGRRLPADQESFCFRGRCKDCEPEIEA
jgi:hypothetical protein